MKRERERRILEKNSRVAEKYAKRLARDGYKQWYVERFVKMTFDLIDKVGNNYRATDYWHFCKDTMHSELIGIEGIQIDGESLLVFLQRGKAEIAKKNLPEKIKIRRKVYNVKFINNFNDMFC